MANIYSKNAKFLKSSLICAVLGIALTILLLLISSAILLKFNKYEAAFGWKI